MDGRRVTGCSFDEILGDDNRELVESAAFSHPAHASLRVAVSTNLNSSVDTLVGRCLGEFAARVIACSMSLEQAHRVANHRSVRRAMRQKYTWGRVAVKT